MLVYIVGIHLVKIYNEFSYPFSTYEHLKL